MLLASSNRALPPSSGFINASADPDLIPEGRRVLDYLYTLPARSDKKHLSGQRYMDHITACQTQTGKFVAIYNDRMIDGEHASGINSAAANIATGRRDDFLAWWEAGGICHEDIKPPHPRNWSSMFASTTTPLNATEMVQLITEDGNAINNNWRTILNRYVSAFLWLQDRKVPLLIRPFHEMNGVFWYRGHNGTDRVKNAWIYTFNYFRAAGVHNLLYWYSPSQYTNASNNQTTHYPGNQYVDIVGFDLYPNPSLWTDTATQLTSADFVNYSGLLAVSGNKPFMLGEYGPRHASNEDGNSTRRADYGRYLPGIKSFAPRACGMTAWNVGWSLRTNWNDGVTTFLNDPWTVNRPDLPNFRS